MFIMIITSVCINELAISIIVYMSEPADRS